MDRAVDETDPAGPRARFVVIQLPDQREGRLNLVRHLTPDVLWQDRFLRHANNAATLEAVEFVVEKPWTTGGAPVAAHRMRRSARSAGEHGT